jgi:hypothetical protein
MSLYRAFGLVLESDLDFPELLPVPEGETVDVTLREDPALPADAEAPESARRIRLDIRVAGAFLVEDGARVTFRRIEGGSDALVRLFLLGSCMGAILQQRGYVVLHGNAVSQDGETCRIIVGHSGAGKSTAAAWHFREGATILADDVCAISFGEDGRARVVPSYPQIKLWRASADLLGIPTAGLRSVHERHDKFAVPLGAQFAAAPLLLTEVVELSAGNTVVAPLKGMAKVNCLIRHSYRYPFIARMGRNAAYLKDVLRLSGSVAVSLGVRRDLGVVTAAADGSEDFDG